MTEWTNDLTNYLLDAGYEATNDITNVIVDDVDDVNSLFETVTDIQYENDDIESVDFRFEMVNRPYVVYIERVQEDDLR